VFVGEVSERGKTSLSKKKLLDRKMRVEVVSPTIVGRGKIPVRAGKKETKRSGGGDMTREGPQGTQFTQSGTCGKKTHTSIPPRKRNQPSVENKGGGACLKWGSWERNATQGVRRPRRIKKNAKLLELKKPNANQHQSTRKRGRPEKRGTEGNSKKDFCKEESRTKTGLQKVRTRGKEGKGRGPGGFSPSKNHKRGGGTTDKYYRSKASLPAINVSTYSKR